MKIPQILKKPTGEYLTIDSRLSLHHQVTIPVGSLESMKEA